MTGLIMGKDLLWAHRLRQLFKSWQNGILNPEQRIPEQISRQVLSSMWMQRSQRVFVEDLKNAA